MPDVGTPSSSVSSPSHTSSEQWQSFEIRMRHRRAERCVARAEAAIEAGRDDEAREALSEAHALNRQSPDFETLKARIDERHAASAAARRTKRLKLSFAVAAVAVVFGLGAVAFLGIGRANNPGALAAGSPEVRADSPANAPGAIPSSGESEDQARQRIVSTGGTVIPQSQTEVPTTFDREAVPAVPTEPKVPDPQPAAVVETPAKPPTTSPPDSPVPPPDGPPLPSVSDAKPELKIAAPTTTDAMNSRPVPPTSVDRLPSGLPSAAAPEPATPPPPPEERVVRADGGDEQKIRAVLAQFESAYSSLNAAAAQAVWPSVDARSLARAFATLESQRVSLGACSVRVTGAVARADCNGTASWTPKIGGAGRTEPRRWSFDLQSTNGAWRIVRAEAR